MATVEHRRRNHVQGASEASFDSWSLASLFLIAVAIAFMLVGIAVRGTTPLVLIAPMIVGYVTILLARR